MNKVIIGVDLGGTNVKTAMVSWDKQVMAKDARPTNADGGPEAVMDAIESSVRDLLADSDVSTDEVMAVGIGAPGPMDWRSGIVFSPPNLPGWENVPLGDLMQTRLGVPCFVENDANVACYGEFWLGAGQGTQNMALLTLGTGVGGGLVLFGMLLRGEDGTAAELGHLKVQRDGRRCGCGSRGCLETYASVTGMVRTAVEGLSEGRDSILRSKCKDEFGGLTGKMIGDAAQAGDEFALWVMEETATWIGLGISSIINYQNPEKVVLCGGMIAAGDMLINPIRKVAFENSFEVPAKRCEILFAGLGSDSGVLGAAGCALARFEGGQ
jgi:glucokinase